MRPSRVRRHLLAGAAFALTWALLAPVPHASAAAAPGPVAFAAAHRPGGQAPAQVTLVTGDRVTVRTDGTASVVTGGGRTGITFSTFRERGHLFVVPRDAVPLLAAGRLDRRLFDVTGLVDAGYDDRRGELPLIVATSGGTRKAAGRIDDAPGMRVRRQLDGVRAVAVRQQRAEATTAWLHLTTGSREQRRLRPDISRVWLDGKRRLTLDTSVPQIGAPAAWQAGYDGRGVTVAVLDSGVDKTHPDLVGQVSAAKNFTEGEEDDRDRVGHGTHVASTIAGTGAASGGRYRGVAPGARLLDGKVCTVDGCPDSWILAGMQWAVDQGADIVNMSLGGPDQPGTDPLEQAVSDLTAAHGTLFVVAAGNDGGEGTVNSPGSADAALTVGAVTRQDTLAPFSGRGPRVGDDGLKPDLTAPGVDIVAARSVDGVIGDPAPVDGYTTLSGTSMATPHVAGAAAIVAQQHPKLAPAQWKALLMGSAAPVSGAGVFGRGAGRVDVGRAVAQSVVAQPSSLSLGRQRWPHNDDQPLSRTVTYRNLGAAPVTVNLTATVTGPDGAAAPDGMVTLSATTLEVPADGEAAVTVTVDTRVDGPDGFYTGQLDATAGDLRVRTPLAVHREPESYDVTLTHINGAGAAPAEVDTSIIDTADPNRNRRLFAVDDKGVVTVRLPKGRYGIVSVLFNGTTDGGITMLAYPRLDVTRDRKVVLDARGARPISVTVPDPQAVPVAVQVTAAWQTPGRLVDPTLLDPNGTFAGLHVGSVGPDTAVPGFSSLVHATMASDDATLYQLAWPRVGRMFTGLRRTLRTADLATVRATLSRQADGAQGAFYGTAVPAGAVSTRLPVGLPGPLPRTVTEYLNTDAPLRWRHSFEELEPHDDEPYVRLASIVQPPRHYRAGRIHAESWNTAVLSPGTTTADGGDAVTRVGDQLGVEAPLFTDGHGRPGAATTTAARVTLHRGDTTVGEVDGTAATFTVPAAEDAYRLHLHAERGAPHTLSTTVDVEWTFRSGHVAGATPRPVAVRTVRFTPKLDTDNRAPAGRPFVLPLTVEQPPGTPPPAALTVEVSYDDGRTWQPATVRGTGGPRRTVTLQHPDTAGFVSLRATATDADGGGVRQTVVRAYRIG